MKLAVLTNQDRKERRKPHLAAPVDSVLLSRVFPEFKKYALKTPVKQKARPPAAQPPAQQRQPVQPGSSGQQNGSRKTALPIPMEVFTTTDFSKPANPPQKNGRHDGEPVQRNGRIGPVPLSRSKPGPPEEPAKPAAHPPASPNTQPAQRQTTTDLQTRYPRPLPLSTPEKSARPAEPPARPAPAAEPARSDPLRSTRAALGLHRLIEKYPDLPCQSVILGACDDGLPLMLDLFDPEPGGVLSIGDERESQLELLRNAIDSAASRNSPRMLQFLVISHQPQTWRAWVNERGFSRHCLAVAGSEDQGVNDWLLRLADWTEQRRLSQISGPPVLLVMDTLSFLNRLTYDVRLNFDWMVKEGPPAQIWPLATISTELISTMGARMLRVFKSRVLGYSKDPQVYAQLVGLSEQEAACFSEPRHFAVQVGESWIHFRLPA